MPNLYGKYIFGDYCSKKVWALDVSSVPVFTKEELLLTPFGLVTFGEDKDGEIYIGGQATEPVLKTNLIAFKWRPVWCCSSLVVPDGSIL